MLRQGIHGLGEDSSPGATVGEMVALALPRVAHDVLPEVLRKELGVRWQHAGHVTATGSLARSIQGGKGDKSETRGLALPLATLIDVVTFGDLPEPLRLDESTFPGPDAFDDSVSRGQDTSSYGRLVNQWRQVAAGRRLRIELDLEASLRRYLVGGSYNPTARALISGRRRFIATIRSLVSAGLRPEDIAPDDPVAELAVRAWAQMEVDVPALAQPRELLWADLDDESRWNHSRIRLAARLQASFAKAFGQHNMGTLVHHGFYFYTPLQWAVFQALQKLTGVDQVFVVHDDGDNPVFSSWQYFFREELAMPVPRPLTGAGGESAQASYFKGCLQGGGGTAPLGLEVVDFRSPVQLVRTMGEELAGGDGPEVFAASHADIRRFASRLGVPDTPFADGGSATRREVPETRLAHLPVGVFLLGLHRCIATDLSGRPMVEITQEAFTDVLGSQCLPRTEHGRPTPTTVQQVLPYFRGCSSTADWRSRSDELLAAIQTYVAPRGLRTTDQDDVSRIATAVANPARLVPWADVTLEQAFALRQAIHELARILEEVAARESVVLGTYLARLHAHLLRGLSDLPQRDAELIQARLRGVGVLADQEVDVVGLVDIVSMVLGRTVDFDDGSRDEEAELERRTISPLRNLDALGFRRSRSAVHLVNMAEDSFPTRVQAVGWPFALKDLEGPSGGGVDPVCRELMAAREQTAALGDLYLFWLALDGVDRQHGVTISWVSGSSNDRKRLSPIASLLVEPTSPGAIRRLVGGVSITKPPTDADRPAVYGLPTPSGDGVRELDLRHAIQKLDVRAAASAAACPRRFAIQWALGPTPSFAPAHLQAMLYGNLREIFRRDLESGAVVVANPIGFLPQLSRLFPFMTAAQLATSEERAGIHRSRPGLVPSASAAWIYTLKGSSGGDGALDRAYQLAKAGALPANDLVAPHSSAASLLPPGTNDGNACSWCPVQARCLHWVER